MSLEPDKVLAPKARAMVQSDCLIEAAKREYIDSVRRRLEELDCKDPDDQAIVLHKDDDRKLAFMCIRSGAKNALSGRMISQLTEALDQLYEWRDCRGLLIYGHEGTFCSGSDLISVGQQTTSHSTRDNGVELARVMQYNLMRLQKLPMISVAFIQGYALGGGAELASATDLRLMTESAKIGFVHIRVGVCCGWGGGSRLVQLLGPSRATDLLATGRLVGVEEAVQLGLANKQVGSLDDAIEYLISHTIGTATTIKALKAMINYARFEPLERALELEAHCFACTWGKEAHLAALDRNIKHKE